MNSAAISVLAEAGILGQDAEILLRRLLSELITPSSTAREALGVLGLMTRDLDPSLESIPEIIRRFADAGLEEETAREIFGEDGARAILALIARVDRLEELQAP